ncbi:MAG TPA: hypothetical protein VHA70_12385 [Bauldia sp.]|nr:hypothetical protein [Bauldia sp.]
MRVAIAAGLLTLGLGAGGALACEDGSITLLADKFDVNSPVWSTTGAVTYTQGLIEMKVKAGVADKIFASPLYQDVDMCADMAVTAGSNMPSIYLGLAFWAEDKDNLYTFQISPSGVAGVYRLKDGKWSTIVDDVKSEAVHQGRDKDNTLRIVTNGKDAVAYVNGEKVADFSGEPPTPGQHIGFVAQASDQSTATFHFDNVDVTAPEP